MPKEMFHQLLSSFLNPDTGNNCIRKERSKLVSLLAGVNEGQDLLLDTLLGVCIKSSEKILLLSVAMLSFCAVDRQREGERGRKREKRAQK